MSLSTVEYAKARDAVGKMLDELRLEAYLFEVEPVEDQVMIKVECALDGEWEAVQLTFDSDVVLRAIDDPEAYRSVRERLRTAVTACLPKGG
jgi:hypothetical protein